MKKRHLLFPLLLSVLTLSCASQRSEAPLASTQASPPGRPLFFEVTKPGLPGKLYLFGSVHLGTEDFYPLPETIMTAWSQSQTLVLEADLGQAPNPAQVMSRIQLPAGQKLSSLLDASTLDALNRHLPELGLRLKDLEGFQPWYVDLSLAVGLIQKEGLKAELGIDRWFLARSQDKKVPLRPLETLEFQLELLAPPELQDQVVSLKETLKQIEDFKPYLEKLIASWKNGDEKTLNETFLTPMKELPGYYQRLIVQRNQNWTTLMGQWLGENQTFFAVVGVAHLVGPDAVPGLLKAQGFTVKRI